MPGYPVWCALNAPNHETAKMILADAADCRARPPDLRPCADAGTIVATGVILAADITAALDAQTPESG